MKTKNQQIIFLNSFLPRTGHNFSSKAIQVISDHKVIPHVKAETRLSRILQSYFEVRDTYIIQDSEKTFMDELFINDLRDKILHDSDRRFLMVKDTTFSGANLLQRVFPDDIHIILIRDPRSVFNSLIKGMDLKRTSHKNRLKRIGNKAGLYPWFYSRKLSRQVLAEMPNLENKIVIKYEDLVNKNDSVLKELSDLFDCRKSLDQIKKEIDAIEVINSSFFEEVGGKRIWDSRPKTDSFNPLHRKSNSWIIRKGIELGSRKLRKRLNYE